jgi:ferrochelatase
MYFPPERVSKPMTRADYDAILILSFGGPETREDVIPFLENVLRGKNVPRERMLEVAEHYYHFGGQSPINQQVRELIRELRAEFDESGIDLPIYWGNRNWYPLLGDELRKMAADGIKRALAFVTSAYSSYSGCRQYLEDIKTASQQVGGAAPAIEKLRVFYNHPGFIEAWTSRVQDALAQIPADRHGDVRVLYTAHSIPLRMAETCDYVQQLEETAALVSRRIGVDNWRLVYQSRSGPPQQPWLEPDICDALREVRGGLDGDVDLVIVPLGFLSDHLEVLYDLDAEARDVCNELGLRMVRAATVGTHPSFVRMIAQLVEERLAPDPVRLAIGRYGPSHDQCPPDCCRYQPGRPSMRPEP